MAAVPPVTARPVPAAPPQNLSASQPASAPQPAAAPASTAYVPRQSSPGDVRRAEAADAAAQVEKAQAPAVAEPVQNEVAAAGPAAEAVPAISGGPKAPAFIEYPVKRGDSLWKIASKLKANDPALAGATIQDVINTIITDNPQTISDGPKRKKDGGMIFAGETLKLRSGGGSPAAEGTSGAEGAAPAKERTAQDVNDELIAAMSKAPAMIIEAKKLLPKLEKQSIDTAPLKAAMTVAEKKCDEADAAMKALITDLKAGKYKPNNEADLKAIDAEINKIGPGIRDQEAVKKEIMPELAKLGMKPQPSEAEAKARSQRLLMTFKILASSPNLKEKTELNAALAALAKGDEKPINEFAKAMQADPARLAQFKEATVRYEDLQRASDTELLTRASKLGDAPAGLKAALAQVIQLTAAKKVTDVNKALETVLADPANFAALKAADAAMTAEAKQASKR